MTAGLSRETLRDIDRWAVETAGLAGVVLMENAGRQAADLAERMLGELGGGEVAVVAGGGNNGGDGLVLARHLLVRSLTGRVYLVADRAKLSPDAAVNLYAYERLGGRVSDVDDAAAAALANALTRARLVVDAGGGTGITGDLRGSVAEAVRQINEAGRPVLALDIPTGLDCDTGVAGDPTVRATATISFVAPKKGYGNPEAEAYTGEVVVADIGLPAHAARKGRSGAGRS